MSDIFISYKREEEEVAGALARELEGRWTVFWDKDLRSGETWSERLETELAEAGCVIVVWSALSVKSEFVRDEARRALRRAALIPVRIEDVETPLGFGETHTVDLFGDEKAAGLERLLHDVEKKLASRPARGEDPVPEEAPAPPEPDRWRGWRAGKRSKAALWAGGALALIALAWAASLLPRTLVEGTVHFPATGDGSADSQRQITVVLMARDFRAETTTEAGDGRFTLRGRAPGGDPRKLCLTVEDSEYEARCQSPERLPAAMDIHLEPASGQP